MAIHGFFTSVSLLLVVFVTAGATANETASGRVQNRVGEASSQSRVQYVYGEPAPDGSWITTNHRAGHEGDFDGRDYFETINNYLFPLRGEGLTGYIQSGKPCSLKAIGYEIIETRNGARKGVFHVRYSEGQTTKDYYLFRAGTQPRHVYLAASTQRISPEMGPATGEFLDCTTTPNRPLAQCNHRTTNGFWNTNNTCTFSRRG